MQQQHNPLDEHVGVISSLSRQYLDLIVRFDQIMPVLATLKVDGIIKKRELDARIEHCKKLVKRIAYATRELANGLRRRMNQLAEDAVLTSKENGTDIATLQAPKKTPSANSASINATIKDRAEPDDRNNRNECSAPDNVQDQAAILPET